MVAGAGLVLEDVHFKDFVSRGERSLEELIRPISDTLVPVFFVLMGLRTDLRAFSSGGSLELALALAQEASVLLLDEPMAGIGAEESARMTELLMSLKGRYAILLVEHDMDAVFALADRITVLVYGQTILTGSVAEVRGNAQVRAAYLGEEHA